MALTSEDRLRHLLDALVLARESGNELIGRAGLAKLADFATGFGSADQSVLIFSGMLADAREREEVVVVSWFLRGVARSALAAADFDTARAAALEALEIDRTAGDEMRVSAIMHWIGRADVATGRFADAKARAAEALEICRAMSAPTGIFESLHIMGEALIGEGDVASAREAFAEADAVVRESGEDRGFVVAMSYRTMGALERSAGAIDRADALLTEAVAMVRQDEFASTGAFHELAYVRLAQGDVDAAHALVREALAFASWSSLRGTVPDILDAGAAVRLAEGDASAAARLLGLAQRLRDEIGSVVAPIDMDEHAGTTAACRAALGESASGRALTEGRDDTIDHAVASFGAVAVSPTIVPDWVLADTAS